jgi:hypothetical protein
LTRCQGSLCVTELASKVVHLALTALALVLVVVAGTNTRAIRGLFRDLL